MRATSGKFRTANAPPPSPQERRLPAHLPEATSCDRESRAVPLESVVKTRSEFDFSLYFTPFPYSFGSMRYSPRNIEISFSHAGLIHYGGILFFNEFSRMLQLRRFLTRHP